MPLDGTFSNADPVNLPKVYPSILSVFSPHRALQLLRNSFDIVIGSYALISKWTVELPGSSLSCTMIKSELSLAMVLHLTLSSNKYNMRFLHEQSLGSNTYYNLRIFSQSHCRE